jgi:hypothetical protein
LVEAREIKVRVLRVAQHEGLEPAEFKKRVQAGFLRPPLNMDNQAPEVYQGRERRRKALGFIDVQFEDAQILKVPKIAAIGPQYTAMVDRQFLEFLEFGQGGKPVARQKAPTEHKLPQRRQVANCHEEVVGKERRPDIVLPKIRTRH